jgi:hypothetical protein
MRKSIVLPLLIVVLSCGVLLLSGSFLQDTGIAGNGDAAGVPSGYLSFLHLSVTAVCAGTAVVLFLLLLRSIIPSASSREVSNPLRGPAFGFAGMLLFLMLVAIVPPLRGLFGMMVRDSSGICQTVVVVTASGILASFLQFLFLSREFRDLERLRRGTESRTGREDSFQNPLFEQMGDDSMLKRKWRAIRETEGNPRADFETLVSFSDLLEIGKESRISCFIKVLPLLGLIGTVTGFVTAVSGMQRAAAGMADFSSFKGDMLGALGGMETAFLTTLAGMVGMVLLMSLHSLLSEARKRILTLENEFLYTRYFAPGTNSGSSQ